MTLLRLDIEQFRCIEQAGLELAPDRNLIVGNNASGKTSLLEAIYLMGTGHSFRTHQTELLVQQNAEYFLTVAKVLSPQGMEVLGIRGTRSGKEVRIGGEEARGLAELALRLPVQVIDPDIHRLLEDGPIRRRRFLDWGVFHVEPQFHLAWRRYQRALRQRNAALKSRQPGSEVRVWDQELIEHGTHVTDLRERYLLNLKPFVRDLGQLLLGLELEIEYQRGWKKAIGLDAALGESFTRDQQRGITNIGPHRADLVLRVANLSAKDRVSRGQQKMLACTLILAQQAHRAAIGAPPACLLLDDPAAELDVDNLGKLLAVVAATPAQLIVTSLTEEVMAFFPNTRLFHVEHGRVSNGIMH